MSKAESKMPRKQIPTELSIIHLWYDNSSYSSIIYIMPYHISIMHDNTASVE